MSKTITLKAQPREEVGRKIAKKRSEGLIPAVMYGHGIDPQNLWVESLDFERVYAKAGESAIISVEVAGKKYNALIHDVQAEALKNQFAHIDFFQVNMDEEIETEIPVEFVGESEAVKALGGILVKTMDSIPVKCLPSDLPEKYEIDLSKLKTFEDVIEAKDLKASAKVEIMLEDEAIIASVQEPRSEEELAALDRKVEADVTKVEGVVKEKADQK